MGDYLRGSGTQTDPYVIHNEGAWEKFLSYSLYGTNAGHRLSKYFEVVANINCGGKTYFMGGNSGIWNAYLNMNGHTVRNFTLDGSNGSNAITNMNQGYIKFGVIDFSMTSKSHDLCDILNIDLVNVCVIIRVGKIISYGCRIQKEKTTNCVFINSSGSELFSYSNNEAVENSSVYYVTNSTLGIGLGNRIALAESTYPKNYPALPTTHWIMDGVSWPTTIPDGRNDLTTGYAVKGVTRVGNSRKSRNITILSGAYRRPIWEGKSDEEGKFFAPLYDYYDAIIPLIFDDYGYPLKKDASYIIGDVIHPSTPNGYRYICEQAGISGQTLPAEPWSVEVLLTTGTAKFRPYPVYEPKCLGPMYPAKVNLITGEKV